MGFLLGRPLESPDVREKCGENQRERLRPRSAEAQAPGVDARCDARWTPPATQSGVVNRQRLGHSTCDTGSHVVGTDLRGQKLVLFFLVLCFSLVVVIYIAIL